MLTRQQRSVAALAGLLLILSGVVSIYYLAPIVGPVSSRNWALNQLYLTEFREKVSWLEERAGRIAANRADPPTISVPGGYSEQAIEVSISVADDSATVYYTLDGSIPTPHSLEYSQPIRVDTTRPLRARAFKRGKAPSEIVTHSYIVGDDIEIPVVVVAAEPAGLFDGFAGIYANPFQRGRAWEREAVVTYVSKNAGSAISFDAGIRIHGNYSRKFPKKSLRVIYTVTDDRYQDSDSLIWPAETNSLRKIVLRQGGDAVVTRLQGMLFGTLYGGLGGIVSPFEPAFVYVNDRPMGIYNIREHVGEPFLRRRFGPGDYDLIIDGERATVGDARDFEGLVDYLESRDLSYDENFAAAAELVDVRNTMDYWLMNIYAASVDWPAWNTYAFRRRDGPDRRWRWISWDTDVTFNKYESELEHNTLAYSVRDELRDDLLWEYTELDTDNEGNLEGTVVIRSLLENRRFRTDFTVRMLDLLNDYLLPENVERHLDDLIELTRADLDTDLSIWSIDQDTYWHEVATIRQFVRERPAIVRKHLREQYLLGPPVSVTLDVEPPDAGAIQINSIPPTEMPWQGTYFEGLPVSVTARPAPGFRFAGWASPSGGADSSLETILGADTKFVALFEPVGDLDN